MNIKIILLITLFLTGTSQANIRLTPGDVFNRDEIPLKLKFERFHTSKTECAVPGFNCGSGYTPEPVTTPIVQRIWKDKTCEQSPRPKHCELDFQILATDQKTYIEIKIINPLDRCMQQENLSNRHSCLLNTIKGHYDQPALDPENCQRIVDNQIMRDSCYEAVADKLGDAKICEKMQGPQGFQCIYLRAKTSKDPNICNQLQIGPWIRTESERLSAISSCLNSVKLK
jgi:hypothetical protein